MMMEKFDLTIFNLSPISMWLQDFSAVRKIFQRWESEGVKDFEHFLNEDLTRLNECLATIRTLCVNQSTLDLYEAKNLDEILENFIQFLTPEVTSYQIKFFCALWNNQTRYAIPVVNYTCTGKQIDIQLSANIVTGYEESWALLLLTTEHISDYQNARRLAESIFMYSPTALRVKDYSEIKKKFDQLKKNNVTNLKCYIENHPSFVQDCFDRIHTKQVNQAFLTLFKAHSFEHFKENISKTHHSHGLEQFQKQILSLYDVYDSPCDFSYETESEYKTLDGSTIYVHEKLNIFPDSSNAWGTIQIAYTDFTERKKLENHLKYVNKYDQLTQLHNRTFFNEEVERLHDLNIFPLSCIYLDINGLKQINDTQGHHCGDLLLQRFAFILKSATQNKHYTISRLGGDEFVILMPYADEQTALDLMYQIETKISEENTTYSKISFSSGVASSAQHVNIEQLIRIADENMYNKKRSYYATSKPEF